jgi:hypothetical protein
MKNSLSVMTPPGRVVRGHSPCVLRPSRPRADHTRALELDASPRGALSRSFQTQEHQPGDPSCRRADVRSGWPAVASWRAVAAAPLTEQQTISPCLPRQPRPRVEHARALGLDRREQRNQGGVMADSRITRPYLRHAGSLAEHGRARSSRLGRGVLRHRPMCSQQRLEACSAREQ